VKHRFLPLASLALLIVPAFAGTLPKQALKTNGIVLHHREPGTTETFAGMFGEGLFYGRLRSNNFYFRWKTEDEKHAIHYIGAVGGSFVFDSARYRGFDFGVGFYGSQAFFNENDDPVAAIKPGKDTLSRYDFVNTDSKAMAVIGQAWLRYTAAAGQLTFGRQLVESFYAKSNDTKMIPNTFDGLTAATEALPDTKLSLGWYYEQKLRDHTQSHAVLMYGDANSSSHRMPQWSENDDSAMHRGLTYTALRAAGKPTDAPLILGDLRNTSIDRLRIDAAFYVVPELLSQVMGELNYTFDTPWGFTLAPGARYIRQFDLGAGEVGGASYTGDATGYTDPDSLESQMVGLRLVADTGFYRVNLAFTRVFDEADLVTPWRGFPTSGYTRSMGIYNWRANTSSYRIELKRSANGTGVYRDLFIQASLLYVDTDEGKKTGYHMSDEIYPYIGFVQNLPSLPALQWKLRLGYAMFTDSETSDYDYLDSRFELNYLF